VKSGRMRPGRTRWIFVEASRDKWGAKVSWQGQAPHGPSPTSLGRYARRGRARASEWARLPPPPLLDHSTIALGGLEATSTPSRKPHDSLRAVGRPSSRSSLALAVCYHRCSPSFLRLYLPRYPARHAFFRIMGTVRRQNESTPSMSIVTRTEKSARTESRAGRVCWPWPDRDAARMHRRAGMFCAPSPAHRARSHSILGCAGLCNLQPHIRAQSRCGVFVPDG
jgi:hypothetical protein